MARKQEVSHNSDASTLCERGLLVAQTVKKSSPLTEEEDVFFTVSSHQRDEAEVVASRATDAPT